MIAEYADMAKRRVAGKERDLESGSVVPRSGKEKTKLTTFRVSADTAQKISELATISKRSIHQLIDEMFGPLIDAALIEANERRLAELRGQQK